MYAVAVVTPSRSEWSRVRLLKLAAAHLSLGSPLTTQRSLHRENELRASAPRLATATAALLVPNRASRSLLNPLSGSSSIRSQSAAHPPTHTQWMNPVSTVRGTRTVLTTHRLPSPTAPYAPRPCPVARSPPIPVTLWFDFPSSPVKSTRLPRSPPRRARAPPRCPGGNPRPLRTRDHRPARRPRRVPAVGRHHPAVQL